MSGESVTLPLLLLTPLPFPFLSIHFHPSLFLSLFHSDLSSFSPPSLSISPFLIASLHFVPTPFPPRHSTPAPPRHPLCLDRASASIHTRHQSVAACLQLSVFRDFLVCSVGSQAGRQGRTSLQKLAPCHLTNAWFSSPADVLSCWKSRFSKPRV